MRFVLLKEAEGRFQIDDGQQRHLAVLRHRGAFVLPGLFHSDVYHVTLQKTGSKEFEVLQAEFQKTLQPHPGARFFVPLIDPPRLQLAIEKLVELGAGRLSLYTSDHCSWSQHKVEAWVQKWEKVETWVLQAAQQSFQMPLPAIDAPRPLATWLESQTGGLALSVHASQTLSSAALNASNAFWIGPEGDFSFPELQAMQVAGIDCFRLAGHSILRSETALMHIASLKLYNAAASA